MSFERVHVKEGPEAIDELRGVELAVNELRRQTQPVFDDKADLRVIEWLYVST